MWKNRNLWILMIAEGGSGLGMWFGIIGNLEFLQQMVPSDFLKAAILLSGLFVGTLTAPYAGSVIDRQGGQAVMGWSGIARVCGLLFMFLALATDSVGWMVLFMVVNGVAASFYLPALQSLIPLIVEEKHLVAANGLHMNVATFSRIAGTALAGLLLTVTDLVGMYLVAMFGYLFLVLLTPFLRIDRGETGKAAPARGQEGIPACDRPPQEPAAAVADTGHRFADLLPVLRASSMVPQVLLLSFVPLTLLGCFNLTVIAISEQTAAPSIKGLLYTTEGICAIAGTFAARMLSHRRNQIYVMTVSVLLVGLAYLSLTFAQHWPFYLTSFAVMGLGVGSFFPLSAALYQQQIPKQFHGRFFSLVDMMENSYFLFVMLTAGLLLDTIGLSLMALSMSSFSLCIIGYVIVRQLWRLPRSHQRTAGLDGDISQQP